MTEAARHEPARGNETRARIQAVALELFAEQGYDKTSLREIAERLNVTKAALYYHFRSKEDIVASLVEDYIGQLDALIAWARMQPGTGGTRREILRRYVSLISDGREVFRMLHQNQAAVSSLGAAKQRGELFRERMTSLVSLLTGPGAALDEQVRAAMVLGGVSVGLMSFADEVKDREKLCSTVLTIACDIAEGPERSG